jgi:phosphoglycolate phosphatase
LQFDAALFDLDGTLLDTLEDIADSMNRVLSNNGYPGHDRGDFKLFVGDGVRVLVERVLPREARSVRTIEKLHAEFRAEYAQRWKNKTKPYDGVPEMLDGLVDRGLSLAVLSNKPDEFTKMCVTDLLSQWRFEVVVGLHDGIPAKPDPTGALQVAERLGVAPARILYAGDTSIDMITARESGMCPVGVLWGFRSLEELEASGARVTVARPQDILDLL